jgi:transporter family protein
MPLWFIFTLLTISFWGIGQIFLKKGLVHLSPFYNNLLASIFYLVLFIPFSISGGINLSSISGGTLILIIIIALSYKLYYYAIGKGKLSLTSTVIATYPLVTLVLSAVFLHETTNLFQKTAILLVMAGTIVITTPTNKQDWLAGMHNKVWLAWALIHVVFAGTGDFLSKIVINQDGIYNFLFLIPLADLLATGLIGLLDPKGRQLPKIAFKNYLPALMGTLMIQVGLLFFYLGFAHGPASLVAPLSSCYTAVTVILAIILLKEKVTKVQLAGIILTIAGIILFGIS